MTDTPIENSVQPVIELNFVPSWARKPASENRYEGRDGSGGGDTRRREPREARDRRRPPGDRGGPGGRGRNGRPSDIPQAAREPCEELSDPRLNDLDVAFLPERRGLAPLAHRLARSVRAFSLFEVSSLFLSKPDFYAVKLSLPANAAESLVLCQCGECRAVFLDQEPAAVHAFARHFDKFCRKDEKETEPPKGNFVCVARCGLSGTLLGPPNHHGFNDRVMEMHRTRFAHLSFEAYRQKIENVHDAALIEKWKDEMRRQITYHFGEGEKAASFSRFVDAETWFREHCLPGLIREGKHFVVPGSVVETLDDGRLKKHILDARQREARFPLKLSVTLRLAFRHFGMHTFKTGDGHTFITAVAPSAMDPTHAIPGIREVLDFVAAHPGCTVQELYAGLRPPAPDAPAPAEPPADVATQLRWLVEKGHVIEFSDGRLAVPCETVSRIQVARPHGRGGGRDWR